VGGVISAVVDAPVEVQLSVGVPEVVEGADLDVAIRAVAQRELVVTAAQVALVAKVAYQYCVPGFSIVKSHRVDTVAFRDMPPWGRLRAAERVHFPISLRVPDAAGSVEGLLAHLSWHVQVRLTVDSAPDVVVDAPVVVLTRAVRTVGAARSQPSAVERRLAILAFEDLSSRCLVPGVPLSGALAVAAWRPWTARTAQVTLIRREVVRRGPWLGADPNPSLANKETEADVVAARQTVAEDLALDPGRIQRLPFTLLVPGTPRVPSTDRDDFSIRWILHARLTRRWRPGPSVELELHGVTAPPGA
jgi:hypothetical protein